MDWSTTYRFTVSGQDAYFHQLREGTPNIPEWSYERYEALIRPMGTKRLQTVEYGGLYYREEPIYIASTISYLILRNAYIEALSGVWQDGTDSFEDVDIESFKASEWGQKGSGYYTGTIKFRRLGG